jgi:hypothetical protein
MRRHFCSLYFSEHLIYNGIHNPFAGALTVLGIHSVVTWSIRQVAASAFYRRKPAIANITLLVRECGLVALTQGFVVLRIIRLFFTTCLYAGPLDTPFLYRGIGELGSYRVDTAPYLFQIDILQHEVCFFWLSDMYRVFGILTL